MAACTATEATKTILIPFRLAAREDRGGAYTADVEMRLGASRYNDARNVLPFLSVGRGLPGISWVSGQSNGCPANVSECLSARVPSETGLACPAIQS